MPSPLSITRFYILFEQTINIKSIREQQKRKMDKVGMLTVDLSEEDGLSKIVDAEFVFGSAEQWLAARGKDAIKSIANPVTDASD